MHDVTGYGPMIYFHDVKALNYVNGNLEQKPATCSICAITWHFA